MSWFIRFIGKIAKFILPRKDYDWLFFKSLALLAKIRHKRVIAEKEPLKKLPNGVNLFTYCNMKNSAGVEGRLLQQMLEEAKIPYHIIDLDDPLCIKNMNVTLYNVNLFICHVANKMAFYILQSGINLKNYYNTGYMAWELPTLPDSLHASIDMFQEMWTLSGFCTSAIGQKATVPVLTLPLFADSNRTVIANGREYFGFNKDAFLFMLAYDCNSYVSRKNPQAAVEAYMKAFTPQDRNVGLVIKLAYPDHYKEHIVELRKMLEPYPNVYFIDKYLSDEEMRTLIQVSDAFVTLHRSEGLGLVPLEAMSLGTPVISTGWSGNMEYMNHMNTALVGYHMVPVDGQYVGSVPGDDLVWAEPDVAEASAHMRRMVTDTQWREKLIANGKYTAEDEFSVKNISKIIRSRLELLKRI